MITNEHFATVVINRAIFHDVPKNGRGVTATPVLSEVEARLDGPRATHLKGKLTQALSSGSAYPVVFNPASASPVPGQIRAHAPNADGSRFVEMSQKLALHLFDQQSGTVSAGLLCLLEITAKNLPGLVILKVERQEGASIEWKDHNGKRTFDIDVLDNLVLTEGTRLFKAAMFLRSGPGDDDFLAVACDTQTTVASSQDLAKFWIRFLGCTFAAEPRVATQRFYDAALTFINDAVTDPAGKQDLYEHLHSQLKSNRRNFSPRRFIEDHVPHDLQRPFKVHLEERSVSLASFEKDISDIRGRLRRRAYHTKHGATVSVPEDNANMIEVQSQRIIVKDSLERVT